MPNILSESDVLFPEHKYTAAIWCEHSVKIYVLVRDHSEGQIYIAMV